MTLRPQQRACLGRQPGLQLVTPSKPNPWFGTAAEGDRYTVQQLHEMARLKLDPEVVESILVKRLSSYKENWWPKGGLTPFYQFECPVLGRLRDGRVKILAPAGLPMIVFGDGWATRPNELKQWSAAS